MRNTHKCYLNGSYYGEGNAEYMVELFKDYVFSSDMYWRKTVDFKIEKQETKEELTNV